MNLEKASLARLIDGRTPPVLHSAKVRFFQKMDSATAFCRRNIEMTPLCKIEVTPPGVLGFREVRRGGVVDEQAGVQSS